MPGTDTALADVLEQAYAARQRMNDQYRLQGGGADGNVTACGSRIRQGPLWPPG